MSARSRSWGSHLIPNSLRRPRKGHSPYSGELTFWSFRALTVLISDLGNLAAITTRAVLAARGACGVRQVLLTARRIGTGDEIGGNRLPLRTTVPGIAAGHLPLRDGHDLLLGVLQVWHPYDTDAVEGNV